MPRASGRRCAAWAVGLPHPGGKAVSGSPQEVQRTKYQGPKGKLAGNPFLPWSLVLGPWSLVLPGAARPRAFPPPGLEVDSPEVRAGRLSRRPASLASGQRADQYLRRRRWPVVFERLPIHEIRHDTPGAMKHNADLLPQREAVLLFVLGSPPDRGRLAQSCQVGVTQPLRQRPPDLFTNLGGATIQRLVQHGQVRPQPSPRLLAPAGSLLRAEARGASAPVHPDLSGSGPGVGIRPDR